MESTSTPPLVLSEKFCRKRLIGELTSGRESVKELQVLLHDNCDVRVEFYDLVHGLLARILSSFSNSISMLNLCDSGEFSDQIRPPVVMAGVENSVCSGDRAPSEEQSGESRKKVPAVKDRRGCYKRRKAGNSWIKISNTAEDEYAWRKYGQKDILNAKNPRCYFRCTHKTDQGCQAKKQVQKLENDTNLYHIAYFGTHTCRNLQKPAQLFSDSQSLTSSYTLNFQDMAMPPLKKDHDSSAVNVTDDAPSLLLVKQEPKAQTSEDLSDNVSSSAVWKDIIALDSSHEALAVMGCTFDYEYSCASTSSPELDFDSFLGHTFVGKLDSFDDMDEFLCE